MRTFLWIALTCSVACGNEMLDEYRIDFRAGNFDNTNLTTLSPGAFRLMLPGKDGLQMLLPAGKMLPTVAISPVFRIRGDFEITTSYEYRRPRVPKEGYGCGATLYLATHDPAETAAVLGRLSRTGNKQVYSTTVSSTRDGERKYDVRLFDTVSRSGRLRLTRIGSMLQFEVTEDAGGSFRRLRETEFTEADVALVRLAAQQSDAATPVDVLWTDLVIRAEALVDRPEDLASGQRRHNPSYVKAEAPERFPLWWSLAAGAALMVVIGSVVRQRRSR